MGRLFVAPARPTACTRSLGGLHERSLILAFGASQLERVNAENSTPPGTLWPTDSAQPAEPERRLGPVSGCRAAAAAAVMQPVLRALQTWPHVRLEDICCVLAARFAQRARSGLT